MAGSSVSETSVSSRPHQLGGLGNHAPFLFAAAVCLAAFTWMLTLGTGRLIADDVFGNFYDYQAQSWLHGRWDVPEPALSGEAFVVHGKVYGYFGPTPALMRLPLVAAGVAFGRLTRVCMLADYAACLLAAYLLLRTAGRQIADTDPPAPLVWLYTVTIGLGTTLFFLGSRAYVYHEAILCGAACALWSSWCAIRYLSEPHRRWWVGALICGLLAVHARPPLGLYALTFLGLAGILRAISGRNRGSDGGPGFAHRETNESNRSPNRLRHLGIALLSLLGVLSYNAVSYLKFGTWEGCPLRFNVQYTPERLASFGGHNFDVHNLRFNTDSYLFLPSASVRKRFPYVFLEYLDRKKYPESRMAYRDPTLALPYSMPALVFLAVIGGFVCWFKASRARTTLLLVWVAALPLLGAMLTAVAVTQRYTADFCGWLIVASAFGAAAIWRTHVRILGITCVAILGAISVFIQGAITLHSQRATVWGVPKEFQQQYESWQKRIDGFFHVEPGD